MSYIGKGSDSARRVWEEPSIRDADLLGEWWLACEVGGIPLLSDLEVLMSVSNGAAELAGDRNAKVAIEAEVELWEAREEFDPGGMVSVAGGNLQELRRRLSVLVRRPELTDRQRAIVSILQAKAARIVASEQ